jgi:hypothetical protein
MPPGTNASSSYTLLHSEGPNMRSPDIGNAIGPDVFIGRKEGLVIGRIEHCGAVVAYPKTKGEKLSPGASTDEEKLPFRVQGANPY